MRNKACSLRGERVGVGGKVLRALQPRLDALPSDTYKHWQDPYPELCLFQAKQSRLSALLSLEMCQSFTCLRGLYGHHDSVCRSEHHG